MQDFNLYDCYSRRPLKPQIENDLIDFGSYKYRI